jgi:hypothetical protein
MCHQCLQNSTKCTSPIGKGAPLTPIGTKWLSDYHIQNGLAGLYKYKNIQHNSQGTPRPPPPGPLFVGGAPPTKGPLRGQSPSHHFPHYSFSVDQSSQFYRATHTFLWTSLVLDMGPHALRHTLRYHLQIAHGTTCPQAHPIVPPPT